MRRASGVLECHRVRGALLRSALQRAARAAERSTRKRRGGHGARLQHEEARAVAAAARVQELCGGGGGRTLRRLRQAGVLASPGTRSHLGC